MKNLVYGVAAIVLVVGGDSLVWNRRAVLGFVLLGVGAYVVGKLAWKAAQWDDFNDYEEER